MSERNQQIGIGKNNLIVFLVFTGLLVGIQIVWLSYDWLPEETTDEIVKEHTIIDFKDHGDVVSYEYLGERVPEKLSDNEYVQLRTQNSYTSVVDTTDATTTLETIVYTQPTFAKGEGNDWYYIETATTSVEAFYNSSLFRFVMKKVKEFYIPVALAVTDTIYSAVGDGSIARVAGNTSSFSGLWDNAHDGTTGTANYTGTTPGVSVYSEATQECDPFPFASFQVDIQRALFPFNTSAIPAAATISSASLNLYVLSTINDDNDGLDYVTVVQTSQASHSSLVSADYDNVGAVNNPTEGVAAGQRKDITSISTSAYLTFTLNATGLGWIKKSGQASNCSATAGISCFGIREGHDATDNSVLTGSPGCEETEIYENSVNFYSSEQTGTANDPYLSVTYTVPATFSFGNWFDF